MATVYLLHFSRPISEKHTCQHYIGYTGRDSLKKRLAEHAAGRGARLTQVALERGISWEVARTWQGGRALERKLKDKKASPKLCPLCNGN
jgi:predicted GIY-YIG superfamily endonuclease